MMCARMDINGSCGDLPDDLSSVCVCVSIESECLLSSSVCTVRILGHGAPSIIVSSRKQDRGLSLIHI